MAVAFECLTQGLCLSRAAGGQFIDYSPANYPGFDKWNTVSIRDSGYNVVLEESKYFPINSNCSGVVADVMNNPSKYEFPEADLPDVLIIHMSNPLLAFPGGQNEVADSYGKFQFIAVIDPWLSETADYFADVILPAATIEKYEGPLGASDQYVDATTLHIEHLRERDDDPPAADQSALPSERRS